jgi:hypothetical protein
MDPKPAAVRTKPAAKYSYLFVLQGDYGYGHGWEDLTAEDKADPGARARIRATHRAYLTNEGGRYRIVSRREPNGATS